MYSLPCEVRDLGGELLQSPGLNGSRITVAGCPEALGGDSAKCTAAPGGESAGVS